MQITQEMRGKTIEVALTDGKDLILRCVGGQEYVIGFDNGPYLKGKNVRIVLPMPKPAVGEAFGG